MLLLVSKFILISLYVFLCLCNLSDGKNMQEILSVPAILVFGDSYADTGNNNYIDTMFKANFLPYGKDFMGGVPTGRFSNGKIISDVFAEGLGVKEYLPPYLDPSIQINDLLTGVCFASAGSGYDPQTTNQTRAIPMLDQLDLFKEYLGKLETNIGEEAAKEIITNSVFLVVASTNDMLFSLPASGLPDDVYDSMLVNLTLSFVQELYKLGARKIGVFSAPPVGCLPVERTLEGGLLRMCAENQNQQAQIFNNMLKGQLPILESNLPQSRIAFVDFYNPLISIINNPEQYGLEVTNRGCCGTGLIEFSYTCNQLVGTCPDDSKYLFFDSGHLSEIGCYIFANLTLPGLVENLF